jgi:hypothetical protein
MGGARGPAMCGWVEVALSRARIVGVCVCVLKEERRAAGAF